MEFKPFKIGRYLLLERLATGGMAEVYRAKASGAGGFEKQMAIKRILPHYTSNEEFQRMFEYEARLSSMLTHANIVQVYDFVKSSDTYLLAMEYVNGKNLRQVVNKLKKINATLPIEHSLYIMNETCKGLEYAHSKRDEVNGKPLNIIHRDMSPQNIMLSYDGAVKIVDFGIAKAKDRVDETRSGVIKGKFGYMSPEQANGNSIDMFSDIFSTGIILWELLTGRRLFTAESDLATLKKIQECDVPKPSQFNPRVTAELERIVMKSLAKDVGQRYTSAGTFHRQLQEFMNKFYPSFTGRELGDLMHKVFQDEIKTENRRYEQLLKQSVPFSQGEREQENDDIGNAKEAVEESITVSDHEEATGITFVDDDDINKELGEPSASQRSAASSTVRRTEIKESAKASSKAANPPVEKTVVSPSEFADSFGNFDDASSEGDSKTAGDQNASTAVKGTDQKNDDPGMSLADRSIKTGVTDRGFPVSEKTEANQELMPLINEHTQEEVIPTQVQTKVGTAPAKDEKQAPNQQPFQLKELGTSASIRLEHDDRTMIETHSGIYPSNKRRGHGPSRDSKELARQLEEEHEPSLNWNPGKAIPPSKRSRSAVFTLLFAIGAVFYMYRLLISGNVPTIVEKIDPNRGNAGSENTNTSHELVGESPEVAPTVLGDCVVQFETDPSGAKVIVEKEDRAETPTKILVPCGKPFNYALIKPGFDIVRENISIKSKQSRVFKSLRKIPSGILELTINHPVDVFLDGELVAKIKANVPTQLALKAGQKHKLRFVNELYSIDTQQIFTIEENLVSRRVLRFEDLQNRKPSGKKK